MGIPVVYRLQRGAPGVPDRGSHSQPGQVYSEASGYIRADFIGASYTVDAVMCSLYGAYCGGGTKVFGLDDGDDASLENTYSATTSGIVAELRIGSFNTVTVLVEGEWRSR